MQSSRNMAWRWVGAGGPMRNMNGFSMIELFIVMVLFGIMAAIAALGYAYVQRHQLIAASQRLFGDLQGLRQNAMTQQAAGVVARGFGVRFEQGTGPNGEDQYVLFQFNDVDNDFIYDGTGEELAPTTSMRIPSSVTVRDTSGAVLTAADVLIYDGFGIARSGDWGIPSTGTMVLNRSGITQARCIVVSLTRLKEGAWNGTQCT